jgi:hypothetical protein
LRAERDKLAAEAATLRRHAQPDSAKPVAGADRFEFDLAAYTAQDAARSVRENGFAILRKAIPPARLATYYEKILWPAIEYWLTDGPLRVEQDELMLATLNNYYGVACGKERGRHRPKARTDGDLTNPHQSSTAPAATCTDR